MMSSTGECYSFLTDLPSSNPSFLRPITTKYNLTDLEYEFSQFLLRKRAITFDQEKYVLAIKNNALFNV